MAKNTNSVRKKKLGIFYTPAMATRLLCDWAIRLRSDDVLEPSFGGCGFLQSSKERLIELGCKEPNIKLYGCDIDNSAFEYLYKKIGPTDITNRFLLADFLTLGPVDFGDIKFDVIIGNPPYVAHQSMYKKQKQAALESLVFSQHSLRGRTSLWAFFLIHSLGFLKKKGRMAWLLPGSVINTCYGKDLIEILKKEFSKVIILPCAKRIFIEEGAKENTVVVLAEGKGYGPANGGVKVSFIDSLDEFEMVVHDPRGIMLKASEAYSENINFAALSKQACSAYYEISNHKDACLLGDLVDVKIGIVTGNNKFFILTKEQADLYKLPQSVLRPIYSKLSMSVGIRISKVDIKHARESNFRCLLVDTTRMDKRHVYLKRYLQRYSKQDREKVTTFKRRELWHRPDDKNDPDGFLSYMSHIGPRLIINSADTTSTNSIHRVYFRSKNKKYEQKLLSISLLTTFSQLSAELEGRSYGSGVLKIEPSEAKAIKVLIPKNYKPKQVNRIYSSIDKLMRGGDIDNARKLADELIFGDKSEIGNVGVGKILEMALKNIRQHRIGLF